MADDIVTEFKVPRNDLAKQLDINIKLMDASIERQKVMTASTKALNEATAALKVPLKAIEFGFQAYTQQGQKKKKTDDLMVQGSESIKKAVEEANEAVKESAKIYLEARQEGGLLESELGKLAKAHANARREASRLNRAAKAAGIELKEVRKEAVKLDKELLPLDGNLKAVHEALDGLEKQGVPTTATIKVFLETITQIATPMGLATTAIFATVGAAAALTAAAAASTAGIVALSASVAALEEDLKAYQRLPDFDPLPATTLTKAERTSAALSGLVVVAKDLGKTVGVSVLPEMEDLTGELLAGAFAIRDLTAEALEGKNAIEEMAKASVRLGLDVAEAGASAGAIPLARLLAGSVEETSTAGKALNSLLGVLDDYNAGLAETAVNHAKVDLSLDGLVENENEYRKAADRLIAAIRKQKEEEKKAAEETKKAAEASKKAEDASRERAKALEDLAKKQEEVANNSRNFFNALVQQNETAFEAIERGRVEDLRSIEAYVDEAEGLFGEHSQMLMDIQEASAAATEAVLIRSTQQMRDFLATNEELVTQSGELIADDFSAAFEQSIKEIERVQSEAQGGLLTFGEEGIARFKEQADSVAAAAAEVIDIVSHGTEALDKLSQLRLDKELQVLEEIEQKRLEVDANTSKSYIKFLDEQEEGAKRAAKAAFNLSQAARISEAVMAGALAEIQAFAALGPIGGAIAAPFVAASVGANIAVIKSQEPPFLQGGMPDMRVTQAGGSGTRTVTVDPDEGILTKEGMEALSDANQAVIPRGQLVLQVGDQFFDAMVTSAMNRPGPLRDAFRQQRPGKTNIKRKNLGGI